MLEGLKVATFLLAEAVKYLTLCRFEEKSLAAIRSRLSTKFVLEVERVLESLPVQVGELESLQRWAHHVNRHSFKNFEEL